MANSVFLLCLIATTLASTLAQDNLYQQVTDYYNLVAMGGTYPCLQGDQCGFDGTTMMRDENTRCCIGVGDRYVFRAVGQFSSCECTKNARTPRG